MPTTLIDHYSDGAAAYVTRQRDLLRRVRQLEASGLRVVGQRASTSGSTTAELPFTGAHQILATDASGQTAIVTIPEFGLAIRDSDADGDGPAIGGGQFSQNSTWVRMNAENDGLVDNLYAASYPAGSVLTRTRGGTLGTTDPVLVPLTFQQLLSEIRLATSFSFDGVDVQLNNTGPYLYTTGGVGSSGKNFLLPATHSPGMMWVFLNPALNFSATNQKLSLVPSGGTQINLSTSQFDVTGGSKIGCALVACKSSQHYAAFDFTNRNT